MQSFDMIVIGSGPAGQRAAIQAGKSGRHAALVARAQCISGVCINTGTIPSKTMREAVIWKRGSEILRSKIMAAPNPGKASYLPV